jgi:hypothetical protein
MSAARENVWWSERNKQQTAQRVAQTSGVDPEKLRLAAEIAQQKGK